MDSLEKSTSAIKWLGKGVKGSVSRVRAISRGSRSHRSTSAEPESSSVSEIQGFSSHEVSGDSVRGGDVGLLSADECGLTTELRRTSSIHSRSRNQSDPPPPSTRPPPRAPPPPPYAPPPLDPVEEANARAREVASCAKAVVRRRTTSSEASPRRSNRQAVSQLPNALSLPPPVPPPLVSCRVKIGGLVTVVCAVALEGDGVIMGISASGLLAPPYPFDRNNAEWFVVNVDGDCVGPLKASRVRALISQGVVQGHSWVWASHLGYWCTLATLREADSVYHLEENPAIESEQGEARADLLSAIDGSSDRTPPKIPSMPESVNESADWYYVSSLGESVGPVSFSHLRSMAVQGELHPESLVWAAHLSQWMSFASVTTTDGTHSS